MYGAYNCTTCAANATIISFKGSTASNTHASVIAFDGNSDYGTINIAESGSPPTLALTACGDIACNKGVAVAAVPLNLSGLSCPQPIGGVYDIGASEYASGRFPAPVLLSAEVVPDGSISSPRAAPSGHAAPAGAALGLTRTLSKKNRPRMTSASVTAAIVAHAAPTGP